MPMRSVALMPNVSPMIVVPLNVITTNDANVTNRVCLDVTIIIIAINVLILFLLTDITDACRLPYRPPLL